MENIDYKELGLKIGLEIHRQIDTDKLFCRCRSTLTEDKPDFLIERILRPIISELGEKDIAAEYELSKGKFAVYEGHYSNTCELEIDESPPLGINKDALNAVLQISKMINAHILNVTEVMRKQVLDYSNTSGFQRTILIGMDGSVIINGDDIKIDTIILEEDAARKIDETENNVRYRLDRLGTSMIEIATAPDIKTPEQAKEVAGFLGMILKSTGKFKSGIGTIRQDINLSIKNGARIELKGVQDLRHIPKIIENEIERQLSLMKQGKKIEPGVRKINPDLTRTYLRPLPGASRIYPETDLPIILITNEQIDKIKIPELIKDKSERLESEYSLSNELANALIKENKSDLFQDYANKYKNLTHGLIAHILVEIPKEISAKFDINAYVDDKTFESIIESLNSGKISRNSIIDIILDFVKNKKLDLEKYAVIDTKDLEKEIVSVIEQNKGLPFGALMGIIMSKFKNKVDGKTASEIIKKYKTNEI